MVLAKFSDALNQGLVEVFSAEAPKESYMQMYLEMRQVVLE
jgi:hypothetical protein